MLTFNKAEQSYENGIAAIKAVASKFINCDGIEDAVDLDAFWQEKLESIKNDYPDYQAPDKDNELKKLLLANYYSLIGSKIELNDAIKDRLAKLYDNLIIKRNNMILFGKAGSGKTTIMSSFRNIMKGDLKFEIISLDNLQYQYRLNGLAGINPYLYNTQRDGNNYPINLCVDNYQFINNNISQSFGNTYDFVNDFIQDRCAIYKSYKIRTYLITCSCDSIMAQVNENTEELYKSTFGNKTIAWRTQ